MIARDFRDEWMQLRADGWSFTQLSKHYGFSRSRISEIVGRRPIPARSILVDRPNWTFPDAELLRVAHEARDEIRQNWK